ncbi:MAG: VWA domain-containing protein [Anaerolineae bacterium]|nr:MAG: VWA domain-containing protein [Anaerolineae bacterium]
MEAPVNESEGITALKPNYIKFVLFLILMGLLVIRFERNIAQAQEGDEGASCEALVQAAVQTVGASCSEMGRNEACYGNTLVAATFHPEAGTLTFESAGDTVQLINVQAMVTEPVNPDTGAWGIAVMKVLADLPETGESNLTFVLFGDTEVQSVVDPSAPAVPTCKLQNPGESINVYAGPGDDRPLLSVFPGGEDAVANGRSEDGSWLRIERNRSIGWVESSSVSLACDVTTLNVADEDDLSDLYTQPMQAFTLNSTSSGTCADAPDGLMVHSPSGERTRVLINGVELEFSSAGFLTAAPDGNMTVSGLEGDIGVKVAGKKVNVQPGFFSDVPLTGLQASGQPSDPEPIPDMGNLPELLNQIVYGGLGVIPATGQLGLVSTDVPHSVGEELLVNVNFTGDATACMDASVRPLDVVLVLDKSGSMQGSGIAAAKGAAANFINQLNPDTARVGVVVFDSGAQLLVPLTENHQEALDAIFGVGASGGTAIDQGLVYGYREILGSSAPERAILLLSDGFSDPAAAQAAAGRIKADGIRLIAVATGADADAALLNSLSSSSLDAFTSLTAVDLRESFNQAALSLSSSVAARDVTVTYRYDPSQFELVEELLEDGGQVVEPGIVQWTIPTVYDTQVYQFTTVLRPLMTGDLPVGTADATYLPCLTGATPVTDNIEGIVLSSLEDTASQESVNPLSGVLQSGSTGVSSMAEYGAERWLVDVPRDGQFSVLVAGAADQLPPQFVNEEGDVITPLYSLRNFDGQTLNVFSTDISGLNWIYLQSQGPEDAGDYALQITDELLDVPVATLTPGGTQFEGEQSNFDGQTFDLNVQDGDIITLRYGRASGADIFESAFSIISLDGQFSRRLYTYYEYSADRVTAIYRIVGDGPYRIIVTTDGRYVLKVDRGDTLREDKGTVRVGQTVSGSSDAPVVKYSLEAPAGEPVTVVGIQPLNYPFVQMTDSEGFFVPLDLFSSGANYDFTIYTPENPGPYEISIDVNPGAPYTLIVGNEADFTRQMGSLTPGVPIEGETDSPEVLTYTINETNQVMTVELFIRGEYPSDIRVEDADGEAVPAERGYEDYQVSTQVYALGDNAPYTVKFITEGNYGVTLQPGDTLLPNSGPITFGAQLQGRTDNGKLGVSYLLDIPDGDTFSVTASPGRRSDPLLVNVVDAQGNFVLPVDILLEEDSSQYAFELGSSGPYTLTVETPGGFRLNLTQGNQVRIARGELLPGDMLIPGQVRGEDPASYTIDVEPGQTISFEIENRGLRDGVLTEFRNVDGQILTPRFQLLEAGYGLSVYETAGDGPYTLTFPARGSFTISVLDGDVSAVDMGAVAFDLPIEGNVDGRIRRAVYTLDAPSDGLYSVQVVLPRRGTTPDVQILGADGVALTPDAQVSRDAYFMGVYNLTGGDSYQISFGVVGQHTVTVNEGDLLRKDLGAVTFGETVTNVVEAPAQVAVYTIVGQPGDVISILAEDRRNTPLVTDLRNAAGEILQSFAQAENARARDIYNIYTLEGDGPYTLAFDGTVEYNLMLAQGDVRLAQKGTLAYDTPAQDQLEAPAVTALYQIEGTAGDVISVQLNTPVRDPLPTVLTAADGSIIEPNSTSFENRNAVNVYTLAGEGPYTFSFNPDQRYTLTVTKGDLLRLDKGPVAFNTPIEDELQAPSLSALYTLDADENISVTVTGRGDIVSVLTDADGGVVPAAASVAERGGFTNVYRLPGKAPYTLSLTLRGAYTLLVSDKDIVRVDRGSAELGTPIMDTIEAPARIALYSVDGEPGDFISVAVNGRNPIVTLVDANDIPVAPQTQVRVENLPVTVFQLVGEPPFRIGVEAQREFTVTVSTGDASRVDTGETLTAGTPLTGRQTGGFQSVYALDTAGDSVTVYVVNNRNSIISAAVLDSEGNLQRAEPTPEPTRTASFTFTLDGTAPYQLLLLVDGSYTLLLPAAPADPGLAVTINTNGSSLYIAPDSRSEVVGTVNRDDPLTLIGRNIVGDWYLAVDDSGNNVWVSRRLVRLNEGDDPLILPIVQP